MVSHILCCQPHAVNPQNESINSRDGLSDPPVCSGSSPCLSTIIFGLDSSSLPQAHGLTLVMGTGPLILGVLAAISST